MEKGPAGYPGLWSVSAFSRLSWSEKDR